MFAAQTLHTPSQRWITPRRAPLEFDPEVNLPGPMDISYLGSHEEASLGVINVHPGLATMDA